MIDDVKCLGEALDSICVVLLSQKNSDGLAPGEALQKLPPQQNYLAA